MKRILVALLLCLLLAAAFGQTSLIVDGQPVPGLDQDTVAGVSYAPARAYADALGAELDLGQAVVELRMPGRLLQLRLTGDPASTSGADSAAVDGLTVEGHAALQTPAGVLLPVKTVAAAFGGFVTVLGGTRDAVDVRLPSASITGLERSGTGAAERLVVSLSSPVPVRTYFNERLDMLQVHFSRTRQPALSELEGQSFLEAGFLAGGQEPELRVQLAPGTGWELSSQPAGQGVRLVLSFTAQAAPVPAGPAAVPGSLQVLLDPSAVTEVVDLALAVAHELQLAGVEVTLTRTSAATQSTTLLGAASADIYLRIEPGAATALNYLADAATEAELQQAITLSGADAATVAQLRRQLLLGHHGELTDAARAAALLAGQLGIEAPVGLPLPGLVAAAGKGMRLSVEADLLADPGLAARVAAGLLQSLVAR